MAHCIHAGVEHHVGRLEKGMFFGDVALCKRVNPTSRGDKLWCDELLGNRRGQKQNKSFFVAVKLFVFFVNPFCESRIFFAFEEWPKFIVYNRGFFMRLTL